MPMTTSRCPAAVDVCVTMTELADMFKGMADVMGSGHLNGDSIVTFPVVLVTKSTPGLQHIMAKHHTCLVLPSGSSVLDIIAWFPLARESSTATSVDPNGASVDDGGASQHTLHVGEEIVSTIHHSLKRAVDAAITTPSIVESLFVIVKNASAEGGDIQPEMLNFLGNPLTMSDTIEALTDVVRSRAHRQTARERFELVPHA